MRAAFQVDAALVLTMLCRHGQKRRRHEAPKASNCSRSDGSSDLVGPSSQASSEDGEAGDGPDLALDEDVLAAVAGVVRKPVGEVPSIPIA